MDNVYFEPTIPEIIQHIAIIAITYGEKKQTDMMIEEMSELTKALLKFRRKLSNNGDISHELENIMEELADVQIMLWQIIFLYSYHALYNDEQKFFEIMPLIESKINRQLERINKEKKEAKT